jgi:2'-5'-oligoadenylate synthetase
LKNCEVKENASLDFVINASETTLVEQLSQLLQARELSCDELGLLYTYKHGVSVSQALKTLGCTEKLHDFVCKQKEFMVENGRVVLRQKDTGLQPFCASAEVKRILAENNGPMDITLLCSKFTQKFNTSIQSIVNMRPAEFLLQEKDLFKLSGKSVSLKHAEGSDSKRQRVEPKTPVVVAPKAQNTSPEPLLVQPPGLEEMSQTPEDSEEYLELHNTISGRSFNSKIAQILNEVVDLVTEKSFFEISHVVKGGSVGKGTAINGVTDAELVFFCKGLPSAAQSSWLPSLSKAVAGVLMQCSEEVEFLRDISVTSEYISVKVKGLMEVKIRFAAAFDSHTEAVQTLGEQGPQGWKHLPVTLTKEKVQFISKQPGQVKVTMRLLKWWRDQQTWASEYVTPSDELLELLAIYSALQTKPKDQRTSVANVMSLMARFNELRIVWSNFYSKDEIWSPLLQQRPLLMDPVNPYVNVADPQRFDASQLMSLARNTHFFW